MFPETYQGMIGVAPETLIWDIGTHESPPMDDIYGTAIAHLIPVHYSTQVSCLQENACNTQIH